MKKLLLLLILLFSSCANQPKTTKNIDNQIVLQNKSQMPFDDYRSHWEQVKEFEANNKRKSALELVKKIYAKAEKEHNTPQIIKSLLYQSKYMLQVDEDAQFAIIKLFRNEIDKQSPPAKNILSSYLAQMYWEYYNDNFVRIYPRSYTDAKIISDDFRTWDTKTFNIEIKKQ